MQAVKSSFFAGGQGQAESFESFESSLVRRIPVDLLIVAMITNRLLLHIFKALMHILPSEL